MMLRLEDLRNFETHLKNFLADNIQWESSDVFRNETVSSHLGNIQIWICF